MGSTQEAREITVADIIKTMDAWAPPSLAMDGDRVGLQVGRLDKPVKRIMVALDAYPEVIAQAVRTGVDMLITHHAMLFRPLARIDTGTSRGKALALGLANDLSVFCAHTNLDICEGGVNDALSERIGLRDVRILDRLQNERLRKLVVFVPTESHEQVLQAVCDAGAGHIGNYSHCTFNTPGVGTFIPGPNTNPYIGSEGRLERVEETRLETIVPEPLVEKVIKAMLDAHPYEEVAYDMYPLEIMGKAQGIGRVGRLETRMSMSKFAQHVRDALHLPHIRYSGDGDRMVETVAVQSGSGGRWASKALAMGADVLVTADCDHHTVAEALQDGIAIVDATHAALEIPVLPKIVQRLHSDFGARIEVSITSVAEDPFKWM